jgi:hypothetical protein
MRKERIVPMMFLVIVLVGVLTLPQGFATFPKVGIGGNRQTPLASTLKTIAIAHSIKRTTSTQQSGNGLPIQGNGLPSNRLLERGM